MGECVVDPARIRDLASLDGLQKLVFSGCEGVATTESMVELRRVCASGLPRLSMVRVHVSREDVARGAVAVMGPSARAEEEMRYEIRRVAPWREVDVQFMWDHV